MCFPCTHSLTHSPCRYNGDWVSECATGVGKFTHANGNCYEGEWLDDKRHGAWVHGWAGRWVGRAWMD